MPGEGARLFPRLKPAAAFYSDRNPPVLINFRNGAHLPLGPIPAFVACLCTGRYSELEIRALAEAAGAVDAGDHAEVRAFLRAAGQHFLDLLPARSDPPRELPDPLRQARRCIAMPGVHPWASGEVYEHPVEIDLYLTERCNMRCGYCFAAWAPPEDGELTAAQFQQALRQAAELRVLRCTITGGEPTLAPGLLPIVRQAAGAGLYPVLASNGLGLNPALLQELADAGLRGIQISLDAASSPLFDSITGTRGKLPLVLAALHNSVRAGFPTSVKAVLTAANTGEAAAIVHCCAQAGVQSVKLQLFEPGLEGRGGVSLFPAEEALDQIEAAVAAFRAGHRAGPEVLLVNPGEPWPAGCHRACRHGLSGFGLLANGDVTICDRFGHNEAMRLGNILHTPLPSLWRSARHRKLLNPDRNTVQGTCRTCPDFETCRTGCFLYSLYAFGDRLAPDPRCPRAHSRGTPPPPAMPEKICPGRRSLFCAPAPPAPSPGFNPGPTPV